MKKVLCNILALLFCSTSFAYNYRKPLIQSATSDSSEYHAFLSLNADYMSFSEYLLLQASDSPINDKISDLYLKAKKFYYEKKYYKAKLTYKKLTGLRNKFQINNHSKKLILNSIIKLYELSSSKIEQRKYFKLLISTYPYINLNDFITNDELLIKMERTTNQHNHWEIPYSFNNYNYLLINGKSHEVYPGKKIKLPKGDFILSLFSNSFYPISKTLSKFQLNQWEPNSEWMNSGDCDSPNLKVNKLFKFTFIFYNQNCLVENDKQSKVLTNQSSYPPSDISSLKPINNYNNVKYQAKSNYKWIKNKWLWIGLGAIATTIVISNNRNKGKNSTNTKHGF